MRIGYARVSTEDQSLNLQLDALQKAGCDKIFQEKLSGKSSSKRPRLGAALSSLSPGDTFIVWRLDRLGRSLIDLINLVSQIHAQGCEFQSLTESIDTATAGGKLIFHLMCALAEFERHLIAERTIAGLNAARARGVKLGGRPKLSSQDVKAVRRLAASGMKAQAIGNIYGVARSTIYRYLNATPYDNANDPKREAV